jgi:hypothetical protein
LEVVIAILDFYALVHLVLLLFTFNNRDNSVGIWFLRILLFGMCYDNLFQALGPYAIGSDWYLQLNYPRYILHAGVLPFLTLFGLFIMRRAKVRVADKQGFQVFCVLFTVAALIYGLWHEVWLLDLVVTADLGHTKLSSDSELPPIATILTNLLVLLMAASVWRVAHWRWFFLGALFIFLVNGATASMAWGFLAGNMAEIVFIIALLKTYWHFKPGQA